MMVSVSILLLATCSYAAVMRPGKNHREAIARRFLPELCPGNNVCNGNQTLPVEGRISCCTDCSCDPDCEEWKCCFPRGLRDYSHSDSVCLFPLLIPPGVRERHLYQSYWMVSDIPKGVEAGTRNVKSAKCGDENVAPIGSLFPVFSKKTRMIYKNMACARAVNVTDGELWDMVLTCKYKDSSLESQDIANLISHLYLTSIPEDCNLQFTYPGDTLDLKPQRCFADLIDTCPRTHFDIPERLHLSRRQIREGCTSGLLSPYRKYGLYANVFCHICNSMWFSKMDVCDIDTIETRDLSGNTLVLLIDGIFMSDDYSKASRQPSIPQACRIYQKEPGLCRKVHCPSGQLRDKNGECVFLVKRWYLTHFELYIKLTADRLFDVEETFKNSAEAVRDNLLLIHEWSGNWTIGAVSKELLNKTMHSTLFVKMMQISPKEDTDQLIKDIQMSMKLPWTLKVRDGALVSMSADLGYNTEYFHYNLLFLHETNITKPVFDYLYRGNAAAVKSTFVITKLYFCEQIELTSSEFEMYDNIVLRNNITNKLLYNGEFSIMFSPDHDDDNQTGNARVCLKDSGYMKKEPVSVLVADKAVCNVVSKFLRFCYVIILLDNIDRSLYK